MTNFFPYYNSIHLRKKASRHSIQFYMYERYICCICFRNIKHSFLFSLQLLHYLPYKYIPFISYVTDRMVWKNTNYSIVCMWFKFHKSGSQKKRKYFSVYYPLFLFFLCGETERNIYVGTFSGYSAFSLLFLPWLDFFFVLEEWRSYTFLGYPKHLYCLACVSYRWNVIVITHCTFYSTYQAESRNYTGRMYKVYFTC